MGLTHMFIFCLFVFFFEIFQILEEAFLNSLPSKSSLGITVRFHLIENVTGRVQGRLSRTIMNLKKQNFFCFFLSFSVLRRHLMSKG